MLIDAPDTPPCYPSQAAVSLLTPDLVGRRGKPLGLMSLPHHVIKSKLQEIVKDKYPPV